MVKKGAQMTMVRDSQHALQGSAGLLFDIYVDEQFTIQRL